VPAVLGTATGCEVLRASKPQSINGLEPRIATPRNGTERYRHCSAAILIGKRALATTVLGGRQKPVDLPLRLDDASASPTTPQAYIGEQSELEKNERASPQSNKAAGATFWLGNAMLA